MMRKFNKKAGAGILFWLLIALQAVAQSTVTGVVTSSEGTPLIGVTVAVKNTTIGTTTNLSGAYTIRIPSSANTLVFSYVGYAPQEKALDGSTASVMLEASNNTLDEVVVSGLATTIKRRNQANSVDLITSKQVTGVTQQQTLDGALYGKFKGANIVANSGAPGGGTSVRLRGISSILGGSQPLYIVDGIYMDNSAVASGINLKSQAAVGGNSSNQDDPSNRIADIAPEDIESVEILKGVSASSIYGSRSAAGVIVIKTKRGQAGKTKIRFDQTIGQATMLNPQGTRQWTDSTVANSLNYGRGTLGLVAYQAAKAAGKIYDYEKEVFGNKGLLVNTGLSISSGNDKTTFFASVNRKKETGIVLNTGYDRTSTRLNVNHKLSNRIDVSIGSYYAHAVTNRGYFNNDNSSTTIGISVATTPAWAELHQNKDGSWPANPYAPANFLQNIAEITNRETIDRLNIGGTITARLLETDQSSLKLIAQTGVDLYSLQTSALFPKTLQFEQNSSVATDGAAISGNTVYRGISSQAFLVHNLYTKSGLNLTTTGGLLALNFNRDTKRIFATYMVGSQTNVDQGASKNVEHDRIPQQDFGFFAQEEVNFKDFVFATVGVRADKSTNNGAVNQYYYYPKANLAVNLAGMQGWSSDKIDLLKLRVAYGQGGQFAPFGAKYTALVVENVDGRSATVVDAAKGNESVSPERHAEIEGGIDIGLLKGLVNIDITAYRRNISDLLLRSQVQSSSGFTSKLVNGADLTNQGVEIGLTILPVNTEKVKWSTTFNYWVNKSKITRLSVPEFTTGSFGATLGTFKIDTGASATQIVGRFTDANGKRSIKVYGNAEPTFQLSWQNNISVGNFDFNMLWHTKQGSSNVNLTTLLYDLAANTSDYDARTLDPEKKLNNGDYRVSQLGPSAAVFVQNSSYIRLREVGLFYNINGKKLGSVGKNIEGIRVGVSAYNPINIFTYQSYDPEVSNFGGDSFSTGVEVTPFPSAKRTFLHLSVQF